MSQSVPMVPLTVSVDCQTATQLPALSVATRGASSSPVFEPAFV